MYPGAENQDVRFIKILFPEGCLEDKTLPESKTENNFEPEKQERCGVRVKISGKYPETRNHTLHYRRNNAGFCPPSFLPAPDYHGIVWPGNADCPQDDNRSAKVQLLPVSGE
ncbi:MAG: hypothetical protein WC593_12480 [Methanoregula sp.]